jgi:hypothetical protein
VPVNAGPAADFLAPIDQAARCVLRLTDPWKGRVLSATASAPCGRPPVRSHRRAAKLLRRTPAAPNGPETAAADVRVAAAPPDGPTAALLLLARVAVCPPGPVTCTPLTRPAAVPPKGPVATPALDPY